MGFNTSVCCMLVYVSLCVSKFVLVRNGCLNVCVFGSVCVCVCEERKIAHMFVVSVCMGACVSVSVSISPSEMSFLMKRFFPLSYHSLSLFFSSKF